MENKDKFCLREVMVNTLGKSVEQGKNIIVL